MAKAPPSETAVAPAPATILGLRVVVLTGSARQRVSIGASPVTIGTAANNTLVLEDRQVSRNHLEITAHPGGVRVRDLNSRNGTFVAGINITDAVLPPGATLKIGDTELLLEPEHEEGTLPLMNSERLGGLIGRSTAMRQLFTVLDRVSPTDYTVLIEGETGTGKEVVARTVHELSPRRNGPMVIFDCASTSDSLLESELFGHVRGAFTGAVAVREGAFRRAHGGTLFIDEINSLPLGVQGKLLRALESRRIHPVGADHEVDVDIRVVAATNRSLADEVRAGRFREDLFFRMSVIRVALAPLRVRREDIPLMVRHFLNTAGIEGEISGPNLDRLVGYEWPGNVRELRNVIERSVALAGTRNITFSELPVTVGELTPTMTWPITLDQPFKDAKENLVGAFERTYALHLMDRAKGNISEAARRAGLSRRHFFELLKKHRLRADESDDGADE